MRSLTFALLFLGACDSDPTPVTLAPAKKPIPIECLQLMLIDVPVCVEVRAEEPPAPAPELVPRLPRPTTVKKRRPEREVKQEACVPSDPLCGLRR